MPAIGLLAILETSLAPMTPHLALWIAANPALSVRDPRATAWVFVRAVEGSARSYAIKPEDIKEEERSATAAAERAVRWPVISSVRRDAELLAGYGPEQLVIEVN